MLISESQLTTLDTSGIKVVKCVKFVKGKGSKIDKQGVLGGFAIVSVCKIDFSVKQEKKSTFKKIYMGFIATVVQWFRRIIGIFIKSSLNQILLLEEKAKVLGNSIKGPIPLEIKRYMDINNFYFMVTTLY